jgi:hypothetical protein
MEWGILVQRANLEGIGFIDEQGGVGGWGHRPKQKRASSETSDGDLTWRLTACIGVSDYANEIS